MNITKHTIFYILVSAALSNSCTNKNTTTEKETITTETEEMSNSQSALISLFEIPAFDVSRAVTFYENILGLDIEQLDMPEMKMGIFPYENQPVSGVIIESEGNTPSSNGVIIYFYGGDDLQEVLDKVEKNGGELVVPKTPHADESGFFALFRDTEGNQIGLHSPN